MSHTSSTSKHSNTHTHTGTRARENEFQLGELPEPTLELAIARCRDILGFTDEAFIEKWFQVQKFNYWFDDYGRKIGNWAASLYRWIENRDFFDAKRDPKRVQPIGVSRGSYQNRKVAEAEALEATRRQTAAQKLRNAIGSLTPEDWALCAESGCRQFENGKCRKRELPCSHMVNRRPCQPTECPDYTNKNN